MAIFNAVAMAVSGSGSLLFGRFVDRYGFTVLIALTLLSTVFSPLVCFGNFGVALVGVAFWSLGMGVHESILPAALAPWIDPQRRASAYGLFTASYGLAWFVGSVIAGLLYGRSTVVLVGYCVACQLAAVPILALVHAMQTAHSAARCGSGLA